MRLSIQIDSIDFSEAKDAGKWIWIAKGIIGTPIEVWNFNDRLKLRSPGALVEPVKIEKLKQRERLHASRNPHMVRVLTDMGYMRELGEGVPRMFEVMEREGLKPHEFRKVAEYPGGKRFEFSWQEANEDEPVNGCGWITIRDPDTVVGEFRFHLGDDSTFTA